MAKPNLFTVKVTKKQLQTLDFLVDSEISGMLSVIKKMNGDSEKEPYLAEMRELRDALRNASK